MKVLFNQASLIQHQEFFINNPLVRINAYEYRDSV